VTSTSVAVLVAFAAIGSVASWKGGEWLVNTTDRLGGHYSIPPVVQGAVIAAIGSSFPEFASTILAALRGQYELGVGAVVGSAVFNILVIPATSALAGGGQLASDRDLVYKEAQFYLLSLSVLLLTFALAALYNPIDGSGTDGEVVGGIVTPALVAPAVALYGLYVFVQWADASEFGRPDRDTAHPLRDWGWLLASLAIITVGAEALVRAAIGFGELFGTPTFLWGLTVVAAGTSLPDTFVSITAARRGNAAVSLANVMGSNVFALLIALPAGVLVAGSAAIVFADTVFMLAFLVVASVAFFVIIRTDMALSRREAAVMIALYGVFVAVIAAESVGVPVLGGLGRLGGVGG
jgi:cation:H+ antiporter